MYCELSLKYLSEYTNLDGLFFFKWSSHPFGITIQIELIWWCGNQIHVHKFDIRCSAYYMHFPTFNKILHVKPLNSRKFNLIPKAAMKLWMKKRTRVNVSQFNSSIRQKMQVSVFYIEASRNSSNISIIHCSNN